MFHRRAAGRAGSPPSSAPVPPPSPMAATGNSAARKMRAAWAQTLGPSVLGSGWRQGCTLLAAATWGLRLAALCGVAMLGLIAWYGPVRPPPTPPPSPLAPTAIPVLQITPNAPLVWRLAGAEQVVCLQHGRTLQLLVRYAGGDRGTLLTLDLDQRLLLVPSRPPAGWRIGPH